MQMWVCVFISVCVCYMCLLIAISASTHRVKEKHAPDFPLHIAQKPRPSWRWAHLGPDIGARGGKWVSSICARDSLG